MIYYLLIHTNYVSVISVILSTSLEKRYLGTQLQKSRPILLRNISTHYILNFCFLINVMCDIMYHTRHRHPEWIIQTDISNWNIRVLDSFDRVSWNVGWKEINRQYATNTTFIINIKPEVPSYVIYGIIRGYFLGKLVVLSGKPKLLSRDIVMYCGAYFGQGPKMHHTPHSMHWECIACSNA